MQKWRIFRNTDSPHQERSVAWKKLLDSEQDAGQQVIADLYERAKVPHMETGETPEHYAFRAGCACAYRKILDTIQLSPGMAEQIDRANTENLFRSTFE